MSMSVVIWLTGYFWLELEKLEEVACHERNGSESANTSGTRNCHIGILFRLQKCHQGNPICIATTPIAWRKTMVPPMHLKWLKRTLVQSHRHIDELVQERRNSSALAMELCLSCIKPSTYALPRSTPGCWDFKSSFCEIRKFCLTWL